MVFQTNHHPFNCLHASTLEHKYQYRATQKTNAKVAAKAIRFTPSLFSIQKYCITKKCPDRQADSFL